MPLSDHEIRQLILSPRESLAVELKDWFDPAVPEGKAKIIKTCLAMRNNNGGYLLVGFDDATGAHNLGKAPTDVRAVFHVDDIQGLVGRFASEPFEVHLHYPERDGQEFPVLEVESGVRAPVASKSELRGAGNALLVKPHAVYVRSLRSNNTPSTTKATWRDWANIIETCFENREADIGRFLRRHLGERGPEVERVFSIVAEDPAIRVLEDGQARFRSVARRLDANLPEHGAWEVGVAAVGELPARLADEPFLNLLMSANPRYTGWPVWIDSRGFPDAQSHPRTFEDGWEALIKPVQDTFLQDGDFWRLEPQGRFYLYRALQDDLRESPGSPEPGTQLDFVLAVLRTAEAIAVALTFAQAMQASEDATLRFAFRWYGLEGRRLSAWTEPGRYLSRNYQALQEEVTSRVALPVGTPTSALSRYVHEATAPLFAAFNGFVLPSSVTEDLTRRLLERNL